MLRHLVHLILLSLLFSVAAFADDGVRAALDARIVVQQPNGKVSMRAATQARPGDIVEYQVTYTNTTPATAHHLFATLPIPAGSMVFVAASAQPADVLASVDGQVFAPLPLQRVVRRADGSTVTEMIPLAEYRFLRWHLDDLPAGKSSMVRARMRVVDNANGVAEVAR